MLLQVCLFISATTLSRTLQPCSDKPSQARTRDSWNSKKFLGLKKS